MRQREREAAPLEVALAGTEARLLRAQLDPALPVQRASHGRQPDPSRPAAGRPRGLRPRRVPAPVARERRSRGGDPRAGAGAPRDLRRDPDHPLPRALRLHPRGRPRGPRLPGPQSPPPAAGRERGQARRWRALHPGRGRGWSPRGAPRRRGPAAAGRRRRAGTAARRRGAATASASTTRGLRLARLYGDARQLHFAGAPGRRRDRRGAPALAGRRRPRRRKTPSQPSSKENPS